MVRSAVQGRQVATSSIPPALSHTMASSRLAGLCGLVTTQVAGIMAPVSSALVSPTSNPTPTAPAAAAPPPLSPKPIAPPTAPPHPSA
jgi:hypothetical protein